MKSEDLCLEFMQQYLDYVPPGVTLLPWHGLSVNQLYSKVLTTFLDRPLQNAPHKFWYALPKGFPAYLNRLQQHLERGVPSDIASVRTDSLTIVMLSFLFTRQLEWVTSDPMGPRFMQVIFKYLKTISWDRLNYTPTDIAFFRRISYLWNILKNHRLACQGKESFPTILAQIGDARLQIVQLVQELVQVWSFDQNLPGNISDLGMTWSQSGDKFILVQSSLWVINQIQASIVNERIRCEKLYLLDWSQGVPVDVCQPRTRHLFQVVDAWFPKESLRPDLLDYTIIMEGELKLIPKWASMTKMKEIAKLQKDWSQHMLLTTVLSVMGMRQIALIALFWPNSTMWECIVKSPLQHHQDSNSLMVLHRAFENFFVALDMICRGWYLSVICHEGGDDYLPFSIFDAASTNLTRQHLFVCCGLMLEMLDVVQALGPKTHWFIVNHEKIDWEKKTGSGVVKYEADMSDYCNMIDQVFIQDVVSLFGMLMGFGGQVVIESCLDKLYTRFCTIFNVLVNVQRRFSSLGFIRTQRGIDSLFTRIKNQRPRYLGILGLYQTYHELPVE